MKRHYGLDKALEAAGSQTSTVIVIDAERGHRAHLADILRAGLDLQLDAVHANASDGLAALERCRPAVAIIDLGLQDFGAAKILSYVRKERLPTKLVFMRDERFHSAICGRHLIIQKFCSRDELLDGIYVALSNAEQRPCRCPPTEEAQVERPQAFLSQLSRRETEIALYVAKGFSNKQIADAVGIADGTVRIHLYNAFRKLGVNCRASLAAEVERSRPAC